MHTIRLARHIDLGTNGVDSDPNNPLSRSLRRLMLDGQPFSEISYCYFAHEDAMSSSMAGLRWVGVLVRSAGERIIFFPGFSITPTWIRTAQGKSPLMHRDFDLDHISLEKGSRRWHFTNPGSKRHYAGGFTTQLGSGQYLWFGMSVAEETILREVRKETIVVAQMPLSDSDRRVRSFVEANDRAAQHIILLSKDARQFSHKGFLHFAFVACPKGAPYYHGGNLGLPFGSPFLGESLPESLRQLPIRTHAVSLGTKVDIQITSMWLPGSLKTPVAFTTRSRK